MTISLSLLHFASNCFSVFFYMNDCKQLFYYVKCVYIPYTYCKLFARCKYRGGKWICAGNLRTNVRVNETLCVFYFTTKY